MKIDEIQEVDIDENGGYKFIVANLQDESRNARVVIRANKECAYHREILSLLRKDLLQYNISAYCIGGGRINIDKLGRTISISSESGDFGREPDRRKTVKALEKAFPEFKVYSS